MTWIIIFLTLSYFDLMTSFMGWSLGYPELNPIVSPLNPIQFVLFKILGVAAIILLVKWLQSFWIKAWLIYLVITIDIGITVLLNSVMLIQSLPS